MNNIIVGEPVRIFRTFWCNPILGGCGHSFEIDQDKLMENVLIARDKNVEEVSIECPICGHRIAFRSKGFTISEFPYRIERCKE